MSKDLAVIIPSWDWQRSVGLVRVLDSLSLRGCQYTIVIPRVETAYETTSELREWMETESPDGLHIIETREYMSPVEAMAKAGNYLLSPEYTQAFRSHDLFLFLHDDAQIIEQDWDQKIAGHFSANPRCGLSGFGGGTTFAHPDIYKVPYDHRQLGRGNFVSNMREAELHGTRVTKPVRVAALDGFALATTREFFEQAGDHGKYHQGVPITRHAWQHCLSDGVYFHMYDAWISCRAAELGYETWMIPVQCHHEGGQTSVKREKEYNEVVRRLGYSSAQELYDDGHRKIYERFRELLPLKWFP